MLSFRVPLGKGIVEEETVTCTMRLINDCPFACVNGDRIIDFSEPPVSAKPTPKLRTNKEPVVEVPGERAKFTIPIEKLKTKR